ncbi:MAG TPA: hypothetical protein PLJ27_16685, partial [Polyangiaceae bacterium]|nr:hypothetical protein [Polyangiaceae bacterium]
MNDSLSVFPKNCLRMVEFGSCWTRRRLWRLMLLCSGLTAGWAFSSWVEASEGVLRPDLVVLADPDGSMEPGVRSTLSLARLLYRYDGVMGDLSLADTESIDVARMAGRSAKVVFIDAPLA